MRNFMTLGLMLLSGVIFAQKEAKHEIEGEQVKSTYYYENGQIRQEGFYKDGKVHGKWISYDQNGTRTAVGEYTNGMKTGKWFFWNNSKLSEVDYSDSRIASVKNWTQDAVVTRN